MRDKTGEFGALLWGMSARKGATWRTYVALLEALSTQGGGDRLVPDPAQPTAREDALMHAFAQRLRGKKEDADALALCQQLGVSPSYVSRHLRAFARWSGPRRVLLADGGNYQLLASLEDADLPTGVLVRGSVAEQRDLLAAQRRQDTVGGLAGSVAGWWPPAPPSGPAGSADSALLKRRIWAYPSDLTPRDQLPPTLARLIIKKFMPKGPGVVLDPMAGSGVIGAEAVKLGHGVWLSDLEPKSEGIAQHDLLGRHSYVSLAERIKKTLGTPMLGDLLVLHPPLRRQLARGPSQLEWFIGSALDMSVSSLRAGGKVVLIVSVLEAPSALQTLTALLTQKVDSGVKTVVRRQGKQVLTHHLAAHVVAVSQTGEQGWHLLVAQQRRAP